MSSATTATTKIRFCLDAGLLWRGQVRVFLNKIKSEITWREPSATVSIDETNGAFGETHFEFQAQGLSAVLAEAVRMTVEKAKKQFEDD